MPSFSSFAIFRQFKKDMVCFLNNKQQYIILHVKQVFLQKIFHNIDLGSWEKNTKIENEHKSAVS
jgi:hypothetical protein